jgi:hypothetical protein
MNPVTAAGRDQTATLEDLLATHADGLLTETAAVDLLITHRYWLTRAAFTDHYIHSVTGNHACPVGAWIDWPAAIAALAHGDLPCSPSQAAILRIAASLAADLPLSLHQALGGLDTPNITAVTTAITAANGTRP